MFLLWKPSSHTPHLSLSLMPLDPQGASTCDPGDSTNAKRQVCYSVAADLEKTHGGDAETSR